MDLSQLLPRLGRSLDKWNDWAETESNTHSRAQLDTHHLWQRCVGRCEKLHLQRLELCFSSQWCEIDRAGLAEREHVPSGVEVQETSRDCDIEW